MLRIAFIGVACAVAVLGPEARAQTGAEQSIAALEEASRAGSEPTDAQCEAALKTFQTVKRDDPVVARAQALIAKHSAELAPSRAHPLTAQRPLARTLLHLRVDIEAITPAEQLAASPAAAEFPGEVPAGAARVLREVAVSPGARGWQGTGLYAAPGEAVKVTVSGQPGEGELRVRIGCHTDQLWRLPKWERVPAIARAFALRPGENTVASPYGGLLYLERLATEQSGRELRVAIQGAVPAPRFVLGVTSDDQWTRGESGRGAPAPWAELESSKIIVTVPSGHVRELSDPGALMRFWDRLSDAHATLAQAPLERARPERFVADLQISAGYMHAGYPIMTHLDAAAAMVSLEKLREGQWGLLHELGHNHQSPDWTFLGTGEVTCNLFTLHAIDTVCEPRPGSRGHPSVDRPPSAREHVERGSDFDRWKKDPFLALQMYIQLQRAFGWEPFKAVFAEYRGLAKEQRPHNDNEKRDQWLVRISRACGRNLGPFFERWGVPTSEAARASIAGMPAWVPEELQPEPGAAR
jgi:hypothetical protein